MLTSLFGPPWFFGVLIILLVVLAYMWARLGIEVAKYFGQKHRERNRS